MSNPLEQLRDTFLTEFPLGWSHLDKPDREDGPWGADLRLNFAALLVEWNPRSGEISLTTPGFEQHSWSVDQVFTNAKEAIDFVRKYMTEHGTEDLPADVRACELKMFEETLLRQAAQKVAERPLPTGT